MSDPEIKDYDYFTSTLGNAYFSGLTFDEMWNSVLVSETREELDVAVSAAINLKEVIDES